MFAAIQSLFTEISLMLLLLLGLLLIFKTFILNYSSIIICNISLNSAINLVPFFSVFQEPLLTQEGLAVQPRCLSEMGLAFSNYFLRQLELHVCISPQVSRRV